jgi:hypothetical protein
MPFFQRTLPLIVAFLAGIIGIFTYYIPVAHTVEVETSTWYRIIAAFAMFLGIHSLLHMHWYRIRRQQAGWGYSLITYAGFTVAIILAIYNNGQGFLSPMATGTGLDLNWMYVNIHVAGGATMFSLLAFFIASAAYRTFRARSTEAVILLLAAIFVMLGRVPIGAYLSDFVPEFAQWLMDVPNLAARRGILLGVSLGAIATALRIIFGIERSYLGEEGN